MITATFQMWRGGNSLSVGPRPYFLVEGSKLFGGDGTDPVATYRSGTWDVDDQGSFVRFRFNHPVSVDLENAGGQVRSLGVLPEVRIVDGSLYTGPDLGLLMLRYSDLSEQWYCYEDDSQYVRVRFKPDNS